MTRLIIMAILLAAWPAAVQASAMTIPRVRWFMVCLLMNTGSDSLRVAAEFPALAAFSIYWLN